MKFFFKKKLSKDQPLEEEYPYPFYSSSTHLFFKEKSLNVNKISLIHRDKI